MGESKYLLSENKYFSASEFLVLGQRTWVKEEEGIKSTPFLM